MIGIVNYGAGNVFSLTSALKRVGLSYGMINTPSDFDDYTHIIIPGVGHAGAAMRKLQESGLIASLLSLKKPTLGICVGMQLLTAFSEEGNTELLHVFDLRTLHFGKVINNLKIPHMGWNKVNIENNCPLFTGIPNNMYFYFVHSYFIECDDRVIGARCEYGVPFAAAIQKDNFFAVQFHPEKSGVYGEQILLNFSKL